MALKQKEQPAFRTSVNKFYIPTSQVGESKSRCVAGRAMQAALESSGWVSYAMWSHLALNCNILLASFPDPNPAFHHL